MSGFDDAFDNIDQDFHTHCATGRTIGPPKGYRELINRPPWLSDKLLILSNPRYKSSGDVTQTSGEIEMSETTIFFNSKSKGPDALLSNFARTPIWWDGVAFGSGEEAYQWAKFYKVDPTTAARVLAARSPAEAKRIGQMGTMNPKWDVEVFVGGVKRPRKCHVMRRILLRKAQQNQNVRDYLLSTGDAQLVEFAPWGDRFWGVDKNKYGNNWLGRLWMEVRAQLREENK